MAAHGPVAVRGGAWWREAGGLSRSSSGHAMGPMSCRAMAWLLTLLLPAQGEGLAGARAARGVQDTGDHGLGQLVAGQWRCVVEDIVSGRGLARVLSGGMASAPVCYPDVTLHAYAGWPPRRKVLDPRAALHGRGGQGWLRWSGWDPRRRTVLLVHGFNGDIEKAPLSTLRDAYLQQGGVNVLSLDWSPLARYPCYADAVRHSRTAARCGAQVLSALQQAASSSASSGTAVVPPGDMRFTTCVGHSLGAHVCGMLSRALPRKLLKVVALDPARPQVARLLGEDALSASAARLVQSFHSNMGFYGDFPASAVGPVGHASFCFNGGRLQPNCDQGSRFARMRCSHFLGVCFYAQLVREWGRAGGWPSWASTVPCDGACNRPPGQTPFAVKLTEAGIDRWRGTYCMDLSLDRACRIDI